MDGWADLEALSVEAAGHVAAVATRRIPRASAQDRRPGEKAVRG